MRKLTTLFSRRDSEGAGKKVTIADQHRDNRQWSEAARAYKEALELDEAMAPIWVQYGHALKESGDLGGAEVAYKRSLDLDSVADTYLQLGHLYNRMQKPQLAEESYVRALKADPSITDARVELTKLGWTPKRLSSIVPTTGPARSAQSDGPTIVLELSDLVDFLQSARYPTGIQRVQLALAESMRGSNANVIFACFDNTNFMFNEISPEQIDRIVDLVDDNSRTEQARRAIASRIKLEILSGVELQFPPNSTIVNVGTSWGYHNYFMVLRDVKRRFGTKYAPLVHDVIPLLFPEYCDRNLIADFINWIDGVSDHADFVFANSENTLRDLEKTVGKLGRTLPATKVVPLNGEFKSDVDSNLEERQKAQNLLRTNNLDTEEYVLVVSTIEPRKNHSIVLNAWSRMIKRDDGRPIPTLVCVGNPGWMNDAFYQRLRTDPMLAEKVKVILNVSDQALNLLYDKALFTIFPSMYEGWGLPISEALAHGKVPLVSNVSAHPEAGGPNAVYFELNSEADFQGKLEQLIYDADFRTSRERAIASSNPLRPWADIGESIIEVVQKLGNVPALSDEETAPLVETGVFYAMARNTADRIENLSYRADRFRWGLNWYPPEEWGCWAVGGTAELRLKLPSDADSFRVYLLIGTPPSTGSYDAFDIALSIPAAKYTERLAQKPVSDVWRYIDIKCKPNSNREVILRLASNQVADFIAFTDGNDKRVSSFSLRGFYVANEGDQQQRIALLEALQFNNLMSLSRRYNKVAKI